MKKKLSFFLLIALALFMSVHSSASAATLTGGSITMNGTASVNVTDGVGEAVVTGSFDKAMSDRIYSLSGGDYLQVRYGKYADAYTPPTPDNMISIACSSIESVCPVSDDASTGGGNFSATISGLAPGQYAFEAGLYNNGTFTPYTSGYTFTVAGPTTASVSVTYGGATVAGSNATVTVSVSGLTVAASGELDLGTASQSSTTMSVTCTPGGGGSATMTM